MTAKKSGEKTKSYEDVLIPPDVSILQAVQVIDSSSLQIALVADSGRRLVGTVTDGDVRRGILRGISLESPVSQVMHRSPRTVTTDMSKDAVLRLMGELEIHQVPVVDDQGCVVGLERVDDLIKQQHKDTWVVLMAGGLGTRLKPLTESVPKPLIPVGGKPLLESIVDAFISQGFGKFYLSVNYKAEMFRAHFGDGGRWGVEIDYLQEGERKGTAGALSLLPTRPERPLIVMNGDLLTSVNFRQLLEFHAERRSAATMCVREYSFQVPYGVVETDVEQLVALNEKPVQSFFVNAGIYVLDPHILDLIPDHEAFDMPDLFGQLLAEKQPTCVFPVREYWLDVGRFDDLERAQADVGKLLTS